MLRGHSQQTESQGEKTAGRSSPHRFQHSEYHVSQLQEHSDDTTTSPPDNSPIKCECKKICFYVGDTTMIMLSHVKLILDQTKSKPEGVIPPYLKSLVFNFEELTAAAQQ